MDNWQRWDDERANQAPSKNKDTESGDFDELEEQMRWLDNYNSKMTSSMPIQAEERSLPQQAASSGARFRDETEAPGPRHKAASNLDLEVPSEPQRLFKVMKITKPKISAVKKMPKEKPVKANPKLMRILVGAKLGEYSTTKNWLNMVSQEPSTAKFIQTEYAAFQVAERTPMYVYEIGLLRSDGTWSKEVKVYYLNGDIYSKHSSDWIAELERDRSLNQSEGTKVIIVCEGIVSQILAHSAKREYNLKSNITVTEKPAPVQLSSSILEHGSSSLVDILTKLKQEPLDKPRRGSTRRSEVSSGSGLFQNAQDLRNFLVRESVDYGTCGEIFMDSLETEELLCSLTRCMLKARKSAAGLCPNMGANMDEASQNDSLTSSRSNSTLFNPQDDSLGVSSRGRLFLKKQTDIQTVEDDLMSIGSGSRGNRENWSKNLDSNTSHPGYYSPSASDEEDLEVICEESAEKTDEKHNHPNSKEFESNQKPQQYAQPVRRGIEPEGHALNKYCRSASMRADYLRSQGSRHRQSFQKRLGTAPKSDFLRQGRGRKATSHHPFCASQEELSNAHRQVISWVPCQGFFLLRCVCIAEE